MVISPTIKYPIAPMPQSARFASRSGCLLTLLAGSLLLRATPEGHPELGRYRIARNVPSASITQIDLSDLPDNREILRICQHICREMLKRCSPKSRAASAAVVLPELTMRRISGLVSQTGNGSHKIITSSP